MRPLGRNCDSCGHYLSEDEFLQYGSWSYRCDECGFKYIHSVTTPEDAENYKEFKKKGRILK